MRLMRRDIENAGALWLQDIVRSRDIDRFLLSKPISRSPQQ